MTEGYREAARRRPEMSLLGLPMHRAGVDEVHAFIDETVSRGEKAVLLNLNVHCVNLAMRHEWLHEFIRTVHLVFCDGDGVRLGLRLLGYSPPPKVTYNEWLWRLAALCEARGHSLFLLGGRPGVADEAARNLLARHPSLRLLGVQDGYFDKAGPENRSVIDRINAASPDILLVCFGMPLQERWLFDNWGRVRAHVFLKGGAALDYASGRLRKAPAWMVHAHLEWLFRLGQEPRRLFARYVLGNPLFLYRVLRERLTRGAAAPPAA